MNNPLEKLRHYEWREIGRRFWPLVQPHRWRGLWAALLIGAVGLAVALQPLFAKYMIDVAIPQRNLSLALMAAGVFLIVMLLRMTLWFWAMTVVYRVQQAIVFE